MFRFRGFPGDNLIAPAQGPASKKWSIEDVLVPVSQNPESDSNLVETENDYQISIDIGDYPKENIELNIEGRLIKVSGSREFSDEGHYHHFSRRKSFDKSFRLGKDVDTENVKAKLDQLLSRGE